MVDTIGAVRARQPEVTVSVCLGLLRPQRGERLRDADAFAQAVRSQPTSHS